VKSYHLNHVSGAAAAREALDMTLSGQREPWLLRSPAGDTIAYFGVGADIDGEPNEHVYADISGRHYHEDDAVLKVLQQIKRKVGGETTYSP
jgi:hypothetical protein